MASLWHRLLLRAHGWTYQGDGQWTHWRASSEYSYTTEQAMRVMGYHPRPTRKARHAP